jgi:CheY-like chemotaxis protein
MPSSALQILLVEDHADTAALMVRYLSRLGYEVRHAETAAAAVAHARERAPQLILTDLSLPDGDGTEMVRTIQALCPVPAIAISGFEFAAGPPIEFARHLTKPIEWDQLNAALSEFTNPGSPAVS